MKKVTVKAKIISCIGNLKRGSIHKVVGCHQSYVSMIHTSLGIPPTKRYIYEKDTGQKSIRKKFKNTFLTGQYYE